MPGSRPISGTRALASGSTDLPACRFMRLTISLVCSIRGGLVLAHRHDRRHEGSDIGGLCSGIAEKAGGNVPPKATRLNLVLDRRVALQPCDGDEVQVEERQFGQRRKMRLNADGRLVRIDADGKIVGGDLQDALLHTGRVMCVVGQGLSIGQKQKLPMGRLQRDAVLEGTDIVSQVQRTCRPIAGQSDRAPGVVDRHGSFSRIENRRTPGILVKLDRARRNTAATVDLITTPCRSYKERHQRLRTSCARTVMTDGITRCPAEMQEKSPVARIFLEHDGMRPKRPHAVGKASERDFVAALPGPRGSA